MIEHARGDIGSEECIVLVEIQDVNIDTIADSEEIVDLKMAAKDKYKAIAFFLSADKDKYSKLIKDMENRLSTGVVDEYPDIFTTKITVSKHNTIQLNVYSYL